jgi:hypothetical protein
MFRIIVGIVEGLFTGLLFNWIVFNLLLDYGKSKPEWLLMVEILIVLGISFCLCRIPVGDMVNSK